MKDIQMVTAKLYNIGLILLLGVLPNTSYTQQRRKSPPRYNLLQNCLMQAQRVYTNVVENTRIIQIQSNVKEYTAFAQEIPHVILGIGRNCLVQSLDHLYQFRQKCFATQESLLTAMGFNAPVKSFSDMQSYSASLQIQARYLKNECRIKLAEFLINVTKKSLDLINEKNHAFTIELQAAEESYQKNFLDITPHPLLEAEIVKLQSFINDRQTLTAFWDKIKSGLVSLQVCDTEKLISLEQMLPSDFEAVRICKAKLARLIPIVAYGKQCRNRLHETGFAANQHKTRARLHKETAELSSKSSELPKDMARKLNALLKTSEKEDLAYMEKCLQARTDQEAGQIRDQHLASDVGRRIQKLSPINADENIVSARNESPCPTEHYLSNIKLINSRIRPDVSLHYQEKQFELDTSAQHNVNTEVNQILGEAIQEIIKCYLQDKNIAQTNVSADTQLAEFFNIFKSDPSRFTHDTELNKQAIAYFKLEQLLDILTQQKMQEYAATNSISEKASADLAEYALMNREISYESLQKKLEILWVDYVNINRCIKFINNQIVGIDNDIETLINAIHNCQDSSQIFQLVGKKIILEQVRSSAMTCKANAESKKIFYENAITGTNQYMEVKKHYDKQEWKEAINKLTTVGLVGIMMTTGIAKDLRFQGRAHEQSLEAHGNQATHTQALDTNPFLETLAHGMREYKLSHPESSLDTDIMACENFLVNYGKEHFSNNGIFLADMHTKLNEHLNKLNNISSADDVQQEISITQQRITAIADTIGTQGQLTTVPFPDEAQKILSDISPTLSDKSLTGNAFQHQLYGEIFNILRETDPLSSETRSNSRAHTYAMAARDCSLAALDQTQSGNMKQGFSFAEFARFLLQQAKYDAEKIPEIGWGIAKGAVQGGNSVVGSFIDIFLHPMESGKPMADLFNQLSLERYPGETFVGMLNKVRKMPAGKQAEFVSEFITSVVVAHKLSPHLNKALATIGRVIDTEISSHASVISTIKQEIEASVGISQNVRQTAAASAATRIIKASSREKILPKVATYEQARNKALEIIGEVDHTTSRPHFGKMGVCEGKIAGRDWHGFDVTIRLDYDPIKGPHINVTDWRSGKGSSGISIAIPFEGDEETVRTLLKHLNS